MRDADIERGKPEERVLDIVAGENGDRPLGGEIAPQQRLADGAGLRQRLGISNGAPAAGAVALGKKGTLGRMPRPIFQPFGQLGGIGAELLRRAQVDAAVGAPRGDDGLRADRDLADAGRHGALTCLFRRHNPITSAGSGSA